MKGKLNKKIPIPASDSGRHIIPSEKRVARLATEKILIKSCLHSNTGPLFLTSPHRHECAVPDERLSFHLLQDCNSVIKIHVHPHVTRGGF